MSLKSSIVVNISLCVPRNGEMHSKDVKENNTITFDVFAPYRF